MKKAFILFNIIILFLFFYACNKRNNDSIVVPPTPIEKTINWDSVANVTYNDLISVYWITSYHRFYSDNAFGTKFNYWWQAHGFDAIVDNLLRTKKNTDQRLYDLRNGIYKRNGDKLENSYYDDMEWMGLAFLRAYNITKDQFFLNDAKYLWNQIKTGWNNTHGGGIAWSKNKLYYKNMPANAPAVILALRLYEIEKNKNDLAFGKKIYYWLDSLLVENNTGKIYDGIGRQGGNDIDKEWQWTYNYGTYIGACVELYKITNDKNYLQKAVTSANYALNNFTNPSTYVLKSQGHGDAGLFNGIFIRYLTELIRVNDLKEALKNKFLMYLEKNAKSLWEKGKKKDANGHILFNEDWSTPPSTEGSIDLSVQLSGQMLMESAALLQREGYIKK